MAGLSNYYEKQVIDNIFKNETLAPPKHTDGKLYISLHLSDPGETGAGELTIGTNNYERLGITVDANATDASNTANFEVHAAGDTDIKNVKDSNPKPS